MASISQLRYSPLTNLRDFHAVNRHTFSHISSFPSISPSPLNRSISLLQTRASNPNSALKLEQSEPLSDGGSGIYGCGTGGYDNGGGGGGGGWSSGHNSSGDGDFEDRSSVGIIGFFLSGWRSRVSADPQFPFKVLMEEVVGLSACVLGDMASRPNFGLDELDFVFSTLVVGAILNFVLMYLLAPTSSISTSSPNLPSIFSTCPKSHMFEKGSYGVIDRFGTFVYKGILFSVVGFAAGLVGTSISNGLIKMRKKMDPNFETSNKPPPTLLNSLTWAIHMGLSCNFRYQTLNGIEFLLEKGLPSLGFKASVVVLRCLNNVVGGVSFVALARLTGSQKKVVDEDEANGLVEEKKKLVVVEEDIQDYATIQPNSK